jgi:hypothetical protein
MASYPSDQFVQEFSKRTSQNLRDIKAGRPIQFEDTALIASLLSVFVLPHERADDPSFMVNLLSEYIEHPLEKIVKVIRVVPPKIEATGDEILPKSVGEIPRFLRNAVAHMNIRPQSADGQSLTHLLVWNTHPRSKKTTFVASIHVARLRSLALHILERLSKSQLGDKYEGVDPIAQFDADHPSILPIGLQ